ncbi:EamA family transporter [Conchiformibius kuhniae]|uniref:EamA family transporter n=1 Tax=Conchiformibius kuhniae TaxID=211502 RepID=A0A8T9MXC2_9NEIS|nr:EamA family transporter [Conchiformibius kuhniae]UOP05066.1 EamA family transporter [Conchiformibius kuhniae]
MIYLLISIFASVAVSVLLKTARKHDMRIEQMVAFNYIVTTLMTLIFLQPSADSFQAVLPNAWLFVLLGVLLPSVFVVMGRAVQHTGIVKSDAAQRLSLFLPVVAAFTVFGEALTANRLLGVLLAFAALLCLVYKPAPQDGSKAPADRQTALLLLGVWAGYGVIDILFKQLSKMGGVFAGSLLVAFVLAGTLMFAYLFARKTAWHQKSMVGGLLLGVLNFVNILFYVKAHQAFKESPTLVFAGMNMGVIVLGTLTGAWLFRERVSKTNAAGIALALAAIVCLYFGANLFGTNP